MRALFVMLGFIALAACSGGGAKPPVVSCERLSPHYGFCIPGPTPSGF